MKKQIVNGTEDGQAANKQESEKLREEVYRLIDSDPELQKAIDELNELLDNELLDDEDEEEYEVRSPFATEGTFYNGDESVGEV